MHIKKYIQFFGVLSAVFLSTACSTEFIPKEESGSTQMRTVKASISNYQVEGKPSTLSEEDNVSNLQACLFENGELTEIYSQFTKENNQYVFQTNKKSGHLYILGNTSGLVDLEALKAEGITEEQWLHTTLSHTDGNAPFFSGMTDLGKSSDNTLALELARGLARFDLSIQANRSIKVKRIVFKQMAQQAFLFSQNPVSAPANAEKKDKEIEPAQALEKDTQGIAYVYEQTGTDMKACVNMLSNGKETTLETSLPSTIKRNTVYVLNITADPATGAVKLNVIEWENGGEHNLSSEAGSLKVDTEASVLPENVTVNDDKNRVVLPYTATQLTLAIDCDDELEFIPDQMPLTVEHLSNSATAAQNVFRIQKERWRLGVPGEEIKLRFHRKGLDQTYPDDFLTLVLTENPTQMEGLLSYNDSYECDFGRYIDNELSILTLPESKKLTVEYEKGEDPWIKLDERAQVPGSYRVLAGWKPNDPTANGRIQKATLVICNNDGTEREEYIVTRRNWGLPVTYFNGVWWCKYNAMGDSKDLNDQILSSDDPAAKAGKTVFDYLRECSPEEFFNLWKWQYQGKTTQGMQVIDDNGVAKLEGYSTSNVHINKLEPTAMAPDGYEMPSVEEFDRVLKITSDYLWLMWNGEHSTAWNGGTKIQRRQQKRADVTVGSINLGELITIAMYSTGTPSQNEPLVWYGSSAQWNNNGILHGHYNNMLWAAYSPENGQGWFFTGAMNAYYATRNSAGSNDSRLLRFKKSDVEYIYE